MCLQESIWKYPATPSVLVIFWNTFHTKGSATCKLFSLRLKLQVIEPQDVPFSAPLHTSPLFLFGNMCAASRYRENKNKIPDSRLLWQHPAATTTTRITKKKKVSWEKGSGVKGRGESQPISAKKKIYTEKRETKSRGREDFFSHFGHKFVSFIDPTDRSYLAGT